MGDLTDRVVHALSMVHSKCMQSDLYIKKNVARISDATRIIAGVTSEYYEKLSSDEFSKLGEIFWRMHRACVRFIDSHEEFENIETREDLKEWKVRSELISRMLAEFNIIELLSSEVQSFVELSRLGNQERR